MSTIAETILQNLPVGLLIIGGDGKIVEASPSACHIMGCAPEGFVGNSWGEIFLSQEKNLEFTEVVLEAIQKEMPKVERITPYYAQDGKKKFLSVISSAQRENGKITAIVVIIEDLTELHDLHEREKAILAQNHRLASERAESLINFARSVAHQIRNPIMAIAGFSRLLERKADESMADPLEAIQDETKKLETMVRSVAEYSAIRIGTISAINLWVIIEDAKHRIEGHPAVKGKDIRWKTDCPDMNVKADRDLMVLALSELLLNSAEFAGPGAEVAICAKEDGGAIRLTVTDHGAGFTDESLDLAFDPFYTTKAVGAGMGLTRAKRIVGEHQGTITITNIEPQGAEVAISLPIAPI